MRLEKNEMFLAAVSLILNGLVGFLGLIPIRAGQFLGRMLGRFLGIATVGPMKSSLNGLRMVFGDRMSEEQLRKLNRRVVLHFAQMLFEVPHVFKLNIKNLHRYVYFENEEALAEALARGKGCFILTGHFGNWELMSAAVTLKFQTSGIAVARPADFAPVEDLLMRLRTRFGTEIIPKKKAMKKLLRGTRENKAMGILLDQNVDWYEGVFVPFLGQPACTNKGLALIAMKTEAPVIPIFSARQPDGRYRVVFEKEVDLIRSGSKLSDTEENTALFNRIINKYIYWYPEQWFWFHKRWKTRPSCPFPRK
ncbi:MAG: lysophospholipid acyltransferase family protein [Deltaproteobacteria bacterium]|jgi:Kdo2-lipid IVA lauroyltransferase/acyltransferase|nr:lysophospholipid acyltransferase family protein [Deltaproteobacteria bacterium]